MNRHRQRITFGLTTSSCSSLLFFLVLSASFHGGFALQEPYASSMRHWWSSLATISMAAMATLHEEIEQAIRTAPPRERADLYVLLGQCMALKAAWLANRFPQVRRRLCQACEPQMSQLLAGDIGENALSILTLCNAAFEIDRATESKATAIYAMGSATDLYIGKAHLHRRSSAMSGYLTRLSEHVRGHRGQGHEAGAYRYRKLQRASTSTLFMFPLMCCPNDEQAVAAELVLIRGLSPSCNIAGSPRPTVKVGTERGRPPPDIRKQLLADMGVDDKPLQSIWLHASIQSLLLRYKLARQRSLHICKAGAFTQLYWQTVAAQLESDIGMGPACLYHYRFYGLHGCFLENPCGYRCCGRDRISRCMCGRSSSSTDPFPAKHAFRDRGWNGSSIEQQPAFRYHHGEGAPSR